VDFFVVRLLLSGVKRSCASLNLLCKQNQVAQHNIARMKRRGQHDASKGGKRRRHVTPCPGLPLEVWSLIAGFLPRAYIPAFRACCWVFAEAIDPPAEPVILADILEAPLSYIEWVRRQGCPWDIRKAAVRAAERGNVDGLRWLQEDVKIDTEALVAASELGNYGKIRRMASRADTQKFEMRNDEVMKTAVENGHIDVLEWLVEQGLHTSLDTYVSAVRGGHIHVLEWLKSRDGSGRHHARPIICAVAAATGSIETLKWLQAQDPFYSWDESACEAAVKGGHFDVLKWLRSQRPPCPWSPSTFIAAIRRGNIEVVEWMETQRIGWAVNPIHYAAGAGQLEILKWFHKRGLMLDSFACATASRKGHWDIVQWLRSLDPPCPWSGDEITFAWEQKRVDMVKWARSQGCELDDDYLTETVQIAYLELREWIEANKDHISCPIPEDWVRFTFDPRKDDGWS